MVSMLIVRHGPPDGRSAASSNRRSARRTRSRPIPPAAPSICALRAKTARHRRRSLEARVSGAKRRG